MSQFEHPTQAQAGNIPGISAPNNAPKTWAQQTEETLTHAADRVTDAMEPHAKRNRGSVSSEHGMGESWHEDQKGEGEHLESQNLFGRGLDVLSKGTDYVVEKAHQAAGALKGEKQRERRDSAEY